MPFKNPHPLYNVWASMRNRCHNPNNRQWSDYGGRGIAICERWRDFHVFVADMGPRPKGYSLDRIDNDAGYSPENCRWASRKQQQRNQRRAVYVEIEGKRYRAIELAEQTGMKTDTIVARAAQGLTYAEVIDPTRRIYKEGLAKGGDANGARQRARTHCLNGHEFTPENTRLTPQGWRRCRLCHNERVRAYNKRRASASPIE